jgi:hypothetical protein
LPDRLTVGRDAAILTNWRRLALGGCPVRAFHSHARLRTRLPRLARTALQKWSGFAWILLLPALSGCLPDRASFRIGMSTSEIVGVLDMSESESSGPPLILVYKQHYLFAEVEPGVILTHPTAHLAAIRPDGTFSISIPTDVVEVEAFFIAPNHLTDEFRFHKQVGIGQIVYRPYLPRMPDWRNHFYTYLVPELEHVIVERRYDLPVHDQATLSAWILDQRKRMEALRKPHADS